VEIFQKSFPEKFSILLIQNEVQAESKFLGLNPQFAREILSWETTISQEEAVRMTANWWSKFLDGDTSVSDLCKQDIEFFIRLHGSKKVK
jgi:nucleoside-diphosphate-sugar epimerase